MRWSHMAPVPNIARKPVSRPASPTVRRSTGLTDGYEVAVEKELGRRNPDMHTVTDLINTSLSDSHAKAVLEEAQKEHPSRDKDPRVACHYAAERNDRLATIAGIQTEREDEKSAAYNAYLKATVRALLREVQAALNTLPSAGKIVDPGFRRKLEKAKRARDDAINAMDYENYETALERALDARSLLPDMAEFARIAIRDAEIAIYQACRQGYFKAAGAAEEMLLDAVNADDDVACWRLANRAQRVAYRDLSPEDQPQRQTGSDETMFRLPVIPRGKARRLARWRTMHQEKRKNAKALAGRMEKEIDPGRRAKLEARLETLRTQRERRLERLMDAGLLPKRATLPGFSTRTKRARLEKQMTEEERFLNGIRSQLVAIVNRQERVIKEIDRNVHRAHVRTSIPMELLASVSTLKDQVKRAGLDQGQLRNCLEKAYDLSWDLQWFTRSEEYRLSYRKYYMRSRPFYWSDCAQHCLMLQDRLEKGVEIVSVEAGIPRKSPRSHAVRPTPNRRSNHPIRQDPRPNGHTGLPVTAESSPFVGVMPVNLHLGSIFGSVPASVRGKK